MGDLDRENSFAYFGGEETGGSGLEVQRKYARAKEQPHQDQKGRVSFGYQERHNLDSLIATQTPDSWTLPEELLVYAQPFEADCFGYGEIEYGVNVLICYLVAAESGCSEAVELLNTFISDFFDLEASGGPEAGYDDKLRSHLRFQFYAEDELLERAAALGAGSAYTEMAHAERHGAGHISERKQLYRKAIELGEIEAYSLLAELYCPIEGEENQDKNLNKKMVSYWYRAGALRDCPKCKLGLEGKRLSPEEFAKKEIAHGEALFEEMIKQQRLNEKSRDENWERDKAKWTEGLVPRDGPARGFE
jgi:hypothetical protein